MIPLFVPIAIIIIFFISIILLFLKKCVLATFCFLTCILLNKTYKVIPVNILGNSGDYAISVLCCNINAESDALGCKVVKLDSLISEYDSDILFLSEFYTDAQQNLYVKLAKRYPYHSAISNNPKNYFFSKYPLGTIEEIKTETNKHSFIYQTNALVSG